MNDLLNQPSSFTKTSGDGAFSVFAQRFWNNLPLALRGLNSIDSYKRDLKTYLFTKFVNSRSLFCKYGHF